MTYAEIRETWLQRDDVQVLTALATELQDRLVPAQVINSGGWVPCVVFFLPDGREVLIGLDSDWLLCVDGDHDTNYSTDDRSSLLSHIEGILSGALSR